MGFNLSVNSYVSINITDFKPFMFQTPYIYNIKSLALNKTWFFFFSFSGKKSKKSKKKRKKKKKKHKTSSSDSDSSGDEADNAVMWVEKSKLKNLA